MEIGTQYLAILNGILEKRSAYIFPKYCNLLLRDKNIIEDKWYLNLIYQEISRELVGALDLIDLDVSDVPSPPTVEPKLELAESSVYFYYPFIPQKDIDAILSLPGAEHVETERKIRFPLHASLLPYLRNIARQYKPEIPSEVAASLKSIATDNLQENAICFLTMKENKVYLKLRYPYGFLSEALTPYASSESTNTEMYFPIGMKEPIITILNENGAIMIVSELLSQQSSFPPIEFDGNVQTLSSIPITTLKGYAESKTKRFSQYGVNNLYSLAFTFPRKYIDRSRPVSISNIKEGEEVALILTISEIKLDYPRKMLRMSFTDGKGKTSATFFNMPWLAKSYAKGQQVILFGKAEGWGTGRRMISFTNPMLEKFENVSAPIIPIYPQSQKAGVTSGEIFKGVSQLLQRIPNLYDPIDEYLDSGIKILAALKKIHTPVKMSDVEEAKEYLVANELTRMQLFLALEKYWSTHQKGDSQTLLDLEKVNNLLPFKLTNAQERVIKEIRADLESPSPMNRLLQGDVGSGKTMVAAISILSIVAQNPNAQVALMAPTEILATQLYNEVSSFLDRYSDLNKTVPIRSALFTNKLKAKEKAALQEELSSGAIQVAVGTHALIADKIEFNNLVFAIIDEQHRFGVRQRSTLVEKNKSHLTPDFLIMTATPIPRTAALTVFGSVEVSTIDELPPGRTPITTKWIRSESTLSDSKFEPWKDILAEVASGRQAYVVSPLVEDNPKLELTSAEETFTELSHGALKGLRLGLVHGQQKAEERTEIMDAFKEGNIDVLISTTVIEVGVNVPNASVIVILDAERFGISQLHQLRGRVGRGKHPSKCYLISKATSDNTFERLQALVDSTDGFYLSEVDLKVRGHGQLFGEAQSGVSDLRVADLNEDYEALLQARVRVEEILANNSDIDKLASLISANAKLDNLFRA